MNTGERKKKIIGIGLLSVQKSVNDYVMILILLNGFNYLLYRDVYLDWDNLKFQFGRDHSD